MSQPMKPLPMSEDTRVTEGKVSLDEFVEDHREELLQSATGQDKLLIDPEGYAKGAIAELKRQLQTVKSPRRKKRLESRIVGWEKTLEVLGDENGDT